MEVVTTESASVDNPFERNSRPTFLTVICILSFIGVGIMLISSLMNMKEAFMTPDEMIAEMYDKFEKIAEMNPQFADMLTDEMLNEFIEVQQYSKANWIVGIIGNILTLAGCIMMWRLSKKGFYIYVIAEIIPFAISAAFFGGVKAMNAMMVMMGFGENMGYTIIGVMLFFDLLFVVFYALNLKSMK